MDRVTYSTVGPNCGTCTNKGHADGSNRDTDDNKEAGANKNEDGTKTHENEGKKDNKDTTGSGSQGDKTTIPTVEAGGSLTPKGEFSNCGNLSPFRFGANNDGSLSDDDLEALTHCAQNNLRTKPRSYLPIMKAFRNGFNDKQRPKLWNHYLMTNEGLPAVDEAIKWIEDYTKDDKTKGVQSLKRSAGMGQGCEDHIEDTGPKGLTGHTGT